MITKCGQVIPTYTLVDHLYKYIIDKDIGGGAASEVEAGSSFLMIGLAAADTGLNGLA